MGRPVRASLWLLAALVGCLGKSGYQCERDDECMTGSGRGICEQATSFCSFPDVQCTSHRRYGALASTVYAGRCVGDVPANPTMSDAGVGQNPPTQSMPDAAMTGPLPDGGMQTGPDGAIADAGDDGAAPMDGGADAAVCAPTSAVCGATLPCCSKLVCATELGTCQPCGDKSQRCCANNSCGARLACVSGTCQCGGLNQPCCGGTMCTSGICVDGACEPCGHIGGLCCAGGACNNFSFCLVGFCIPLE